MFSQNQTNSAPIGRLHSGKFPLQTIPFLHFDVELHPCDHIYRANLHVTDVEWKLVFLSSPGHPDLDQELDSCLVGPIPVGINSFEFMAPAPEPTLIPQEDLLGVAAIILSGAYKDAEFVRVGYYQNTEYDDEELKANPPERVDYGRLVRELAADKPRVTRFNIRW